MRLTFRYRQEERGGRLRVWFGRLVKGAGLLLLTFTFQANQQGSCLPVEPEEPVECYSDADCAADQHCELPSVTCPPGAYCILPAGPGTCVDGPPPPQGCYTDADCKEDERCVGAVPCPPDVICILPASPGVCEPIVACYGDADCPPGQECVGARECPPGMYCILPASPGVCEPGVFAGCAAEDDADDWRALAERAAAARG